MSSAPVEIHELDLPGCFLLRSFRFADNRGEFFKTYHQEFLQQQGLHFELREEFFSISNRGTLRGMHFQVPPHDHQKLVICLTGRILDVLVDLRLGSPMFGKHFSIELNAAERQSLWIPKGIAHGFLTLEDETCIAYKTDCEHSPESDKGIRWDSFEMDWPSLGMDFILSVRDLNHPQLIDFDTPFQMEYR